MNKGSDKATFGLKDENDEITRYQSGRYISTSEAVWRILSFPIHERFPPVVHLDVHLENGQRIYFNPVNLNNQIENPRNTTLMAFFKLCQEDDFAKTLLYDEIPLYYIFDKQNKIFKKLEKRGRKVDDYVDIYKENVIGRVYTIHPSNTECFYLRLLLHNIRGPVSFEALKTIDNIIHPTYQSACKALNLIEDDSHWDETLKEASLTDSPQKIRQLFAVMLVFCIPSDPMELWIKYKKYLSEDYLRIIMRNLPDADPDQYTEEVENRCLIDLNNILISISGNSLNHYGLPTPTVDYRNAINNREYLEEINYDQSVLSQFLIENEPKLNKEQNKIYNEVINSVSTSKGDIFFIDAPGGTGKTFLINLILAKVRNSKKIALAVASSGIAATLLPGGKTAHSMFKIPLNLDITDSPVCNISKNTNKAELLQKTCLIVWDECTMANKKAIEAVDRTLQDLRDTTSVMGGITFLFSGDFRQTLPVITGGTRADELNASLKQSYIWNEIKKLSLSINMRVKKDSTSLEFSNLLLNVGEGTLTENQHGEILLPEGLCKIVSSIDDLIEKIYPGINDISNKDNEWFSERAIYCVRQMKL
ncbi:uncharacterized protein LOC123273344 [Cotesia glomerata]|uniref:uncharacterized protein LOC123273344 n=1 Tax=Cotesia glomerata TaxID=32391 RepID=UPI001D01760E|nr:uncharacterized protein LOC123273344 [Cotesia glomerata]